MNELTQTNYVTLSGKVASSPVFSHEVYGEKFYEIILDVKRLSDMTDSIPVSVSERLMLNGLFDIGKEITVNGQFRSYNKVVENKSKLMLTVFVKDAMPLQDGVHANSIYLEGFVCKPTVFRTTPFNREIADILLAVNRQYNKSDYIPCIAWGRNARYVKTLPVGTHIAVNGRVQSRAYQKRLDNQTVVTRTAYEVSVSKVTVITDSLNLNSEQSEQQRLRVL